MFAVEFFCQTVGVNGRRQLVPPMIAALLHMNRAAGAFNDDTRLHGRSLLQRFVHRRFQFHFMAAAPSAVCGDDCFALRVIDAIDEGVT